MVIEEAKHQAVPSRRTAAHKSIWAFALVSIPAFLTLTGCAARHMKSDFTGFESAYAETSNHEVLLNLARLENHDPTYFFKLGQISTSYRVQAGVSGFGNYVPQGNTAGGANVTGGGTPSFAYESNPAFTFIPVNDDTNAQFLLKPIPAVTFYTLYEQGWRLDQLFRLMVDRIELTVRIGDRCSTETIRNVPPLVDSKTGTVANREQLNDYVRFLRTSAILYALQKQGFLLLRGGDHFEAFDEKSKLPSLSNELGQPDGKPAAQNDGTGSEKGGPSPLIQAKDFNDAWAKNAVWQQDQVSHTWQLGQEVFNPVFLLNPPIADCPPTPDVLEEPTPEDSKRCFDLETVKNNILNDPQLSATLTKVKDLVPLVLGGLLRGFSIEGTELPSGKLPCEEIRLPEQAGTSTPQILRIHLVMRSLLGLMAAAAQEQEMFAPLQKVNPAVPPDLILDQPEQKDLNFANAVPAIERIPLLHLKWTGTDQDQEWTDSLMAPLYYRGDTYKVADPVNPAVLENQSWNRDMFRLISELSAQVTVDISKFPLPEVLQLRTQ